MKVIVGDIWKFRSVAIPTNGIVKANGRAVMGAGIFRNTCSKFLGIDSVLGRDIKYYGNISLWLGRWDGYNIFSFPTKNHYSESSSSSLITQSATRLVGLVISLRIKEEIALPAVGCGLGNLNWIRDVEPILNDILSDQYVVCLKP